LEPLEPRALLSGVTIIAHGAQFLGTSRPGWLDSMATAIRNRAGASTAIYTLRVVPDGSGVKVASFSKLSGPSPTSASSTNNETVLLLDWAAASTVNLLGLSAAYSVSTVASAVIPYLTTAYPNIGLTVPLVEGSIQLIGHSRGVPLVTEIAKNLGQRGIWVDQVTSLDSVPVPPDPNSTLRSNVIYADNYYQHSGDGFLVPNGSTITGSTGFGPLSLGGAYGTLDGQTHGDVHLYYHGTINTASKASDGSAKVVDSWYSNNNTTKATTGFYYSRLGGGTRANSGIASAFGGSGSRSSISHGGTQWGNIATIKLSEEKVGEDGEFSATFRYNSFNTAATISWFLDVDTNPYNNNSIAISTPKNVAATGDAPVASSADFQINTTGGTYYLVGRISNSTGTRYTYSSSFIVGNLPPTGAIDGNAVRTTLLTGWADDSDEGDASINIRAESDGVVFYQGAADIDRPGLAEKLGSTAHGFSVDLSQLSGGWHEIKIFALDAVNSAPALIGTRRVYTNLPPTGKFESAIGRVITGWALDPNAGGEGSRIQIRIDNLPPIYADADVPRPDLEGSASAHGFSVTLPQLKPGAHNIRVYAVDASTGALKLLGKKQTRIADVPGNRLPMGAVTAWSASLITGWAFDPGAADSIQVRIDVDGIAGTPFLADAPRPEWQSRLGGSNFGFSKALSLTPGEHKIDVYAIDSTSGAAVLLGSRILGRAAPRGALETATPATLSGYAWSAALGASPATIRIDIDGLIGQTQLTAVSRTVPGTSPAATGPFGFSLIAPPLPAGKHTATLYYIDPFTLVATKLASKTLVAA
jgi:hypothetical protein